MTTHVCLVSVQLPANLIPALMDRPDRVVLLVSEDMAMQAERLRRMLADRGMPVDLRQGLPSSGMAALRDYATEVASSLEGADGRVVLNATGGNKLMALAFVDVFRDLLPGTEVIYTDTEHGCVENLTDREHPTRMMEEVLDIPTYLAAYGMTYRSAQSGEDAWLVRVEGRKPLTKWFAEHAKSLEPFFGVMNGLANSALERAENSGGFAARQTFRQAPAGEWRKAMQRIAEEQFGLVDWDGRAEVIFRNVDAARYLGGGWLEEYAWHVVHDEHPHDVRANVVGTWESGSRQAPGRNEFDLLAVHHNRMLVVECKTGVMEEAQREANILYKLESLGRNAGGRFGQMWLVSLRSLGEEARSRARAQGIAVFEGEGARGLRDAVRHWMAGGHL